MLSWFRAGKCSMPPSPPSRPTIVPPSNAEAASCHPLVAPNLAAAIVLAILRAYKTLISPLFAGCCRFYPSCADYMAEAVAVHGALRGMWLGARRLLRCQPLGGHGVDPVPHA